MRTARTLLKTSVFIYVLLIVSHVGTSDFSYNHSSRLASHFVVLRCNDWGFDPRWSWPKGGQLLCALRYLSMAHRLSASNVGGDTRDDSAKNNLYLESQNHSFASIMGLFVRSLQK